MKCSKTRTYLKDYLNARLNSRLTEQVAGHITACNDCRKELDFLKSYLEQTKAISKIPAPPDFLSEIQKKIRDREYSTPSPRPRFLPLPVPVATLASILIVAVFVFFINNHFQFIQNNQSSERFEPPSLVKTAPETAIEKIIQPQPPANGISQAKTETSSDSNLSRADNKVSGTITLTLLQKSAVPPQMSQQPKSPDAPLITKRAVKKGSGQTALGTGKSRQSTEISRPDDINQVINQIKTKVNILGGRLENTPEQPEDKSAQLVITLPVENYQSFLTEISKYGQIQKPYPVINFVNKTLVEIKLTISNGNE